MSNQDERVNDILAKMLVCGVIEDHNRELSRDLLICLYQRGYEDGKFIATCTENPE